MEVIPLTWVLLKVNQYLPRLPGVNGIPGPALLLPPRCSWGCSPGCPPSSCAPLGCGKHLACGTYSGCPSDSIRSLPRARLQRTEREINTRMMKAVIKREVLVVEVWMLNKVNDGKYFATHFTFIMGHATWSEWSWKCFYFAYFIYFLLFNCSKSLGSTHFFFKEINTFIQQGYTEFK